MSNITVSKSLEDALNPRSYTDFFESSTLVSVEDRGNFQCYKRGNGGLPFLALHAVGSCSLTWSLLTRELSKLVKCQFLAIDMRGHGNSFCEDDDDISIQNCHSDVLAVLRILYPVDIPEFIILGQGWGASIGIELAMSLANITAVIAMDSTHICHEKSIPKTLNLLETRPNRFKNLEEGILWYLKTPMTSNPSASRISVPGLLYNERTRQMASEEVKTKTLQTGRSLDNIEKTILSTLLRDDKISETTLRKNSMVFAGDYIWRNGVEKITFIKAMMDKSLAQKFLSIKPPKLMILTNVLHLDDELVKGQMQGKFRCDIIPIVGVYVQEDRPDDVAESIFQFCLEYKLVAKKDILAKSQCRIINSK